jgi:hypothetical protein
VSTPSRGKDTAGSRFDGNPSGRGLLQATPFPVVVVGTPSHTGASQNEFWEVRGIAEGEKLSVRSGPSTSQDVVGEVRLSDDPDAPEVFIRSSGEIEVSFKSGCGALFDADGEDHGRKQLLQRRVASSVRSHPGLSALMHAPSSSYSVLSAIEGWSDAARRAGM